MKLDTYEVELIKQHKGEYVNRVSYQGWMRPPLATVQLVDQVRLSHSFIYFSSRLNCIQIQISVYFSGVLDGVCFALT